MTPSPVLKGHSESDVRHDRYKGLREDVRFTGNEDDVEVGLTAFAKRTYAPALGWRVMRRRLLDSVHRSLRTRFSTHNVSAAA